MASPPNSLSYVENHTGMAGCVGPMLPELAGRPCLSTWSYSDFSYPGRKKRWLYLMSMLLAEAIDANVLNWNVGEGFVSLYISNAGFVAGKLNSDMLGSLLYA